MSHKNLDSEVSKKQGRYEENILLSRFFVYFENITLWAN